MPRYSTNPDILNKRRETVAQLAIRQLTQREIVRALALDGQINPRTQKPWDVATINKDIHDIREAWRQHAIKDIGILQGEKLQELAAIKRRGWEMGDLHLVLKAIKQECEILGLEAPLVVVEIEAKIRTLALKYADAHDLEVDAVIAEAQRLALEGMRG
jgi:hypothetical protein